MNTELSNERRPVGMTRYPPKYIKTEDIHSLADITTLSSVHTLVLDMHEIQKLSLKEIARATGLSIEGARKQIINAKLQRNRLKTLRPVTSLMDDYSVVLNWIPRDTIRTRLIVHLIGGYRGVLWRVERVEGLLELKESEFLRIPKLKKVSWEWLQWALKISGAKDLKGE